MRILIIATWFPPDRAVAAVRPYMFAKYLTKLGHDVTVLCSGMRNTEADRSLFSEDIGVRVISYLEKDSSSQEEERAKKSTETHHAENKSRISFLPVQFRIPISRVYHFLTHPMWSFRYLKGCRGRYAALKCKLDQMGDEAFDLVFSTYGEMENIWGGIYASELFSCKYIQDFRDGISNDLAPHIERWMWDRLEKRALQKADVYTAISYGLVEQLSKKTNKPVYTIFNGYEPTSRGKAIQSEKKPVLCFCYTGSIYSFDNFTPLFHALQELMDRKIVNFSDVEIHYAGNAFAEIYYQAKKCGMTEILVNHGYVSRKEAESLQNMADYFLVSRCNTKKLKGVISGKFFEGIRAKKPIITLISGDCPHSELWQINEQYHYGFCYEQACASEHFPQLVDYLEQAVLAKQAGKSVAYSPEEKLFCDFRYDTLTKKLETIMTDLVKS